MIKAVLIDIDNTLLDFDAYVQNAMKDGFAKFNLGTYNESMFAVFNSINSELWQRIEQGSLTYDELHRDRWNIIFAALNINFDGCTFEQFFRACLFDSAIPVEGAEDLLCHLKDRYILCAASNGPFEQQVNRLKCGGMLSYFDEIFVSERIGASKPSDKFFSYCLKRLNEDANRGKGAVLPSEVMMIGDSLTSDILGAVNSGIKTCLFDRKRHGKTNGLPIDYVVNTLGKIKSFL